MAEYRRGTERVRGAAYVSQLPKNPSSPKDSLLLFEEFEGVSWRAMRKDFKNRY